jgi:hypothetical protein
MRLTMISTRNLTKLPTIETLRKLTQSLAMLDAILMREWGTDQAHLHFREPIAA